MGSKQLARLHPGLSETIIEITQAEGPKLPGIQAPQEAGSAKGFSEVDILLS